MGFVASDYHRCLPIHCRRQENIIVMIRAQFKVRKQLDPFRLMYEVGGRYEFIRNLAEFADARVVEHSKIFVYDRIGNQVR